MMRSLVAVVCCLTFALSGGCNKFAGEWLEEGHMTHAGEYVRTEGPRRMALKFEPIATVRSGAYIDGPNVVDAQVTSADTYFTMQGGNVAQFGATIAKVKDGRLTTWVGAEESRQFVRIKGPSVFPPQVVAPSLESAANGG